GAANGVCVGAACADAELLPELLEVVLTPAGDGEVVGRAPPRAEEPAQHRLAEPARAEDRDPPAHRRTVTAVYAARRPTTNRPPAPGCASTSPETARASRRERASPNPAPLSVDRPALPRTSGSKIASCSSEVMPGPSSSTAKSTAEPLRATRTRTSPRPY